MAEILTGLHAVEEAIRAGRRGTLYFEKRNKRISAITERAAERGIEVVSCQPGEIEKRTGRATDTGVLFSLSGGAAGKVRRSYAETLASLDRPDAVILFLDGVTDPQNYGAILRSADQFGVDLVVHQERRSAGETDAVARASAGAVQYVETVTVPNLSRAILQAKEHDFWIYGADMTGDDIDRIDLRGKTAIVMGREGEGLHRLIKEACDRLVRIPTSGHVDSLNVSVSAGILLYEIRRQGRG